MTECDERVVPMKPSSRWTRGTVLAALPAFVAAGVMAGCGAAGAHHGAANHGGANHGGANHGGTGGHGKVVAFVPIPYRISSEVDTGVARTVKVMVRPGQRFSVKVATSDGPFWWRQVG